MDKDVRRAVAPRQETVALGAVEPLDPRELRRALRRHVHMGARWRQLRGMSGARFVHREDAERLETLGSRDDLEHHAGAFVGGLVSVAPQAGDVKQHVRPAVVRHDEAVTFADIEPLDAARHLGETF